MQYRRFGNTDIDVSVLGFGCGAVGGLMVRGQHEEMIRSVEHALEHGINYFDTARMYGDGLSEIHTGAVLREIGASEVVVGTKVKLSPSDYMDIPNAIETQIDNSLSRLGLDAVDIVYTHDRIGANSSPSQGVVSEQELEQIVGVFDRLVSAGKIRYWGFNGLGETSAIKRCVEQFRPSGIHTCFNMLNASSLENAPPSFDYQDYENLSGLAASVGAGTVAIRVLAAGALTGTSNRHEIAEQSVVPIATGQTLDEDLNRASDFNFLVAEGYASSMAEAAVRFSISFEEMSTSLVGLSSFDHIEQAITAVEKGPLDGEILERLKGLRTTFVRND